MAPLAEDLFGDAAMFDSLMGDDMLEPMFSSYNGSLTLAPELCPVAGSEDHDPMLAALLALDDSLTGGDINMV